MAAQELKQHRIETLRLLLLYPVAGTLDEVDVSFR